MGIEAVSLIIAAFVNAGLGIAALLRNFRSVQCISFALMTWCFFAHDAITVFELLNPGNESLSHSWHLLFIYLAGPSTLWFLKQFVPSMKTKLDRCLVTYFPMTLVLIILMSLPSYPVFSSYVFISGHLMYLFPTVVWIVTLQSASKNAVLGREKLRLSYAFVGSAVTLGFYISDLFYVLGFQVPPLGTVIRELYFYFIFLIFIQKELTTLEEAVAKIALFSGVALMLSTIYSFLVSWVGDQRSLFFFNTLIASLLIILLFEPIRNFSAWLTRRIFLKKNRVIEDGLNSLLLDLRGLVEVSELAKRVSTTLRKIIHAENCSLFVLDGKGLSFVRFNSEGRVYFGEQSPASSSLVEYMRLRRGRPFVLETLEIDRDSFYSVQARKFCQDCLDEMRKLGADFLIPFLNELKPVGFCTIKKGDLVVLSNEQLRLFLPVCRQIGVQLRNSQVLSAFRERDKLAAVGEMAAGLAHEIKNPLGAIKGASELLMGEAQKGEKSSEYLQIIQDETNRLSGVLSDFLDYAKPRRNCPQPSCNPIRVIEHTAAVILRDSDVHVEIEADKDPILIRADPDVLKQVLLNLMINAVQSMEPEQKDRRIKIRLKAVRPRQLSAFVEGVPLYKKFWEGWQALTVSNDMKSYVEIEIEDNGCGIPEEDRDKVFAPFYTTKPKGTGLGLAICMRLLENMNGTISVRPNYPRGTVFTLHLSLNEKEREAFETGGYWAGMSKPMEVEV